MPTLKRLSILLVILTLITTAAQAYYDPHTGRFTQRDPIGDGVNWYAYTYNNPLKYTDPNGEEPVQDQAGTVDEFTEEFSQSAELLDFVPSATGSDSSAHTGVIPFHSRYIYTEKLGWIDMQHFLSAAAVAFSYSQGSQDFDKQTNAFFYANAMGYGVELDQFLAGDPSGFSYEDLPSNWAGASFGIDYVPDSELTLGEQIRNWINNESPIDDPRKAPNYNLLPATYSEDNPAPPKNFTPKPYKFPQANQEDGG